MEEFTPISFPGEWGSQNRIRLRILLPLLGFWAAIMLTPLVAPLGIDPDWAQIAILIVLLAFFGVHFFRFAILRVRLEPEQIRWTLFGKTVQTIPVSQLQFISGGGDSNGDLLVFSVRSIEELAALREQQLKKGVFTRDEVKFRKKASGWEERFANEYVCALARNHLWHSPDKKLIWMGLDQITAPVVRTMYPQVPFYNWQARPDTVYYKDSVGPLAILAGPDYRASLEEDGIRVREKGREIWYMGADRIQTVVRWDDFGIAKDSQHHRIFLLVSSLGTTELEQMAKPLPKGMEQLDIAKELRIMRACYRKTAFWTKKTLNFCPLWYTPEHEARLRELYPNAQWVDLSRLWRSNENP